MATIKIKLTKDLLSLISNIRFSEYNGYKDNEKYPKWSIDLNSIYGGSFLLEDIAYIINRYDEHIDGTEDDVFGPAFPKELEDYMYGLHYTIMDNLQYIEDLVHQFCNKGGLTEGTYKCKDYERIWTKIDE